jgi:ribonuclease P/MRP protein subunit RPP1
MIFYEFVRAFPEGSSSASRMALTARNLGYQGIIIFNCDPGEIFMPSASQRIKGIDVVIGAEVTASNARSLKSRIGALRARYPFLAVRANSDETARIASEDPNVDLLLYPSEIRRPLTIAAARAAKLNQITVGFDLSPIVQMRGEKRARFLQALRLNLQLLRKFEVRLAITACARSHLDLRSPRDLMALAEVAGFLPSEAREAMSWPALLLALNRRKWVAPGVELL